ncbi:MAG: low molecular weight phosphotyrosine protein phosphatase [Bacteroidetes bacterium]|nr:low molecular weight phosphotyrosine protein phosphatase [Bacteroidota bacterium]
MSATPTRVLAVCLGNICRSPMAEGVLRHHIQTNGLRIKVDSAGTNGYHNGEAPDRRAQQEMRRHGIDISKQVSRQIARKDFDDFDLILVMDESNLQDVTALAGDREDWVDKIHLFLEEDNVPDPYYGGADGFAHVYELVDEAAADWVRRWKSGVLA